MSKSIEKQESVKQAYDKIISVIESDIGNNFKAAKVLQLVDSLIAQLSTKDTK